MKRYLNINPATVINVIFVSDDFTNDEIKDDEYRYLCKTINKETVLLPYNPLITIKQFIAYKYAITSGVDELNIKVEKIMVYIDYYGFVREKIVDINSNNEIIKIFDTFIQATEALVTYELEENE